MRDFAQISASGGWEYQQMKYLLKVVRQIWQSLSLMFVGFMLGQSYHDLSLGGWLYFLAAAWAVSTVLDFYLTWREPSEAYKQYLADKKESEARGKKVPE